ncbi:MAG: hypothetical protein VXY06_04400, partial [Bacteroidota bacterium]|nr:hypothetical protein [Bacteroidota bacterium]
IPTETIDHTKAIKKSLTVGISRNAKEVLNIGSLTAYNSVNKIAGERIMMVDKESLLEKYIHNIAENNVIHLYRLLFERRF